MTLAIIIAYAITLIYLCTVERYKFYALLIALQGGLLFLFVLSQGAENSINDTIFMLAETAILKVVLIPYLLYKIIAKIPVPKIPKTTIQPIHIALIGLALLGGSIYLAKIVTITTDQNPMFFWIAIFASLTGLLLIITKQRVFSHLIGFLVIENSILFFSIAINGSFSAFLSIGIVLDALMGILMIGLLLSRFNVNSAVLNNEEASTLQN